MSINTIAQSTNKGVSKSREYLDNKANIILRPESSVGINGFLFDVEDTETLTEDSDITDYFTENGDFINDHIVDKPLIVTLTGFIGELVHRVPQGVEGTLNLINNKLSTIEAYAGDFTPGAVQVAQEAIQQAQAAVSAANQALDKTQNMISAFSGEEPQPTLQEKAYIELSSMKKSRVIMAVQTPWGYMRNMVIKTISFTQSGESKDISDISVTVKEFRRSSVKITEFDETQFTRQEVQAAEEEDQGIIRGVGRDSSFLFEVTQ